MRCVHTLRPEWGSGRLVKTGEGKRTFRFEDGKARTFMDSHSHLLEQVDDGEEDKPKPRCRRWTVDEDKRLRLLATDTNEKAAAHFPGRSPEAIKSRRMRLRRKARRS